MSLNEDKLKNFLVIGIGNPLRCDDGVGPYVADCIEAKSLSGVKVWITQQLFIEDIERMLEFKRIILVDASTGGLPIDFHLVEKTQLQAPSSSHHLSAETFVNLASSIYQKDVSLSLCSIRGSCFDVGDKISPEAQKNAQKAVHLICDSFR
jgi:hydrogenase 3 maturation protease